VAKRCKNVNFSMSEKTELFLIFIGGGRGGGGVVSRDKMRVISQSISAAGNIWEKVPKIFPKQPYIASLFVKIFLRTTIFLIFEELTQSYRNYARFC
jgi:hypothetical protein